MNGIGRPPSAAAIRRALDCVLASDAFARSERLRSFLRYVVENELAGKAVTLKGYSIGIDVFGRPPGFDAGSDPLVRVQAGKLRKLLEHYYETEGAGDDLRIRIPLGSYVPEYEVTADPAPAGDDRPAAVADAPSPPRAAERAKPAQGGWLPAPVSSPLALLSLLPLVFLAPTIYPDHTSAAIDGSGLAIAMHDRLSGEASGLPRVHVPRCFTGEAECNALADAVASSVAYHKTVRLSDLPAEAGATPLSYSVRIDSQPDGRAIVLRLVHDRSGSTVYARHLWREELNSESSVAYEAVSFAARTLSTTGLVYRHAMRNGIASSLMRCLAGTQDDAAPDAGAPLDLDACPLRLPEAMAEARTDGQTLTR